MEIYEAVAFAMRYWFVFAVIAILFCVIIVSIAEYVDKKRIMAYAGAYLGYLEVIYTEEESELEQGDRFALARQNLIGSAAGCDIIINDRDIMRKHAKIFIRHGEVMLEVNAPANTQLNGRPVKHDVSVKSGDVLLIGETALMVHLKEVL